MKKNKISQKFKEIKDSQSGFTLFVALIVSSMLLSIGLSISNIILKQLIFSGSGRESQIAFYAADSGAECALYWDVKDLAGLTTFDGPFSKNTPEDYEDLKEELYPIRCGFTGEPNDIGSVENFLKNTIVAGGRDTDPATTTTIFHIDMTPDTGDVSDPACAVVTVIKEYFPDQTVTVGQGENPPMLVRTRIESRGYNTTFSGGECDLSSPRIVERAVVLTY